MEGDSRNPRVSLLKKYDIPVDHLTYEYIEQCSNKKELERIIRILRSGEEGMYPDLVKNAEEKLRKLAPNSRALRVEAPILTRESFTEEEWKEVEEDLLSWEKEMKVMDKSLDFEKKRFDLIGNKNLPDVRKVTPQTQQKVEKKKVKIETNKKNERIRSGDYTSWDKFDVDKELLKLDLEDERKAEENAKKKREIEKEKKEEKKIEIVNPEAAKNCTTTTEQQILANQAKDRGNECFKSGDLDNALKYYGVSIKLHATANAYNNRAMTYIKLKKFENALTDCNEVLKLEPNNVKALHRRATAYQNIPSEGNDKLALQDLTRIISLEPNNKVAQTDLQALKKKLKIEDNSKRFRMAIHETDPGDKCREKKSEGNKLYSDFYDNSIPVERLPLTFYGPSTSTFECEPLSITHRFLSGPTMSGRVMCKCNSNSPRQNPLCQRCGEQLCRPKPVPKTTKTENKDFKTDNNKKNELLKQNNGKPEPQKEVKEKVIEKKEDGADKNKESVNEVNEKSKTVKTETKEVNKKFKEDWDNFINSKFDGAPKWKPVYPNNEVDDGKTAFITEIFDEDEVKENKEESASIEEEKMDEAPEGKVEKEEIAVEHLKKKIEEMNIDDSENNKLEEEKIEIEKESAEKNIEDSERKKDEKNIENECKQFGDNKEIEENGETQEEVFSTKDNSDNQSLPSTSSQTEKKCKNKKKKQRDRTNRECKYSYPGPVKVQQAPKYLKPTSVEPKTKPETSDSETREDMIKNSSNLLFKSFVPNRKCLSTDDVLKSNRTQVLSTASIDRDNRLESHNGDGEIIRIDVNEEGNKENISEVNNINKCNDGGGEEVRPVRRLESGYEFIKEWESYKKTDETYVKRAEIMRCLHPCDLGKVIGNKLDSEMLQGMLECLERHFMETDPKTAVEFIKQLIHVPRFGTVRLFMDSSEKKIIERLVESAESKGLTLDQEVKKGWTIA